MKKVMCNFVSLILILCLFSFPSSAEIKENGALYQQRKAERRAERERRRVERAMEKAELEARKKEISQKFGILR